MGIWTKWMRPSYKAIKSDIFTQTKTSFGKKGDEPWTDEGQRRNGCFNIERWKLKPSKKIFQSNRGGGGVTKDRSP